MRACASSSTVRSHSMPAALNSRRGARSIALPTRCGCGSASPCAGRPARCGGRSTRGAFAWPRRAATLPAESRSGEVAPARGRPPCRSSPWPGRSPWWPWDWRPARGRRAAAARRPRPSSWWSLPTPRGRWAAGLLWRTGPACCGSGRTARDGRLCPVARRCRLRPRACGHRGPRNVHFRYSWEVLPCLGKTGARPREASVAEDWTTSPRSFRGRARRHLPLRARSSTGWAGGASDTTAGSQPIGVIERPRSVPALRSCLVVVVVGMESWFHLRRHFVPNPLLIDSTGSGAMPAPLLFLHPLRQTWATSNGHQLREHRPPSPGDVVDQLENAYDGWGNLSQQWQAQTGAVDTSTTPSVQYTYADGAVSGVAAYMRLAGVTDPTNTELSATTMARSARPTTCFRGWRPHRRHGHERRTWPSIRTSAWARSSRRPIRRSPAD